MIFSKLIIENFLSYNGKHIHQFNHDRKNNIEVFLGKGGSGKTNLANAIRWVLFGRRGFDKPKYYKPRLLNYKAQEEGKTKTEVILEFEHNDSNYIISRKTIYDKEPRDEAKTPKEKTQLTINGKEIPENEISKTINSLLPRRIAKYFFLDFANATSLIFSSTGSIQRLLEDIFMQSTLKTEIDELSKFGDILDWMLRRLSDGNTELDKIINKLKFEMEESVKSAQKSLLDMKRRILNKRTKKIQRIASDMLLKLEPKETIQGISLDEDFIVSVLTSSGESIPFYHLAAGDKTSVALSLLLAISRILKYEIPFLFDGLFARLSSEYRSRFTEVLSDVDRQTILLTYESSISELMDLGSVGKILKIGHDHDDGSSYFDAF